MKLTKRLTKSGELKIYVNEILHLYIFDIRHLKLIHTFIDYVTPHGNPLTGPFNHKVVLYFTNNTVQPITLEYEDNKELLEYVLNTLQNSISEANNF